MSRDLQQLQHWLQSVITHPGGVQPGINSEQAREQIDLSPAEVESVITRSAALSSLERLGIYANAYSARLLQCLAEEYPALHHAVGADSFNSFAFGYLQVYPSTSYTLGQLSKQFPVYLQETRPEKTENQPDWADFIIDLATLERTYSDVFDGPGIEEDELSLSDGLDRVTPERWLDCRLAPVPCLRLLRCEFPVHEYASSVRKQQDAQIPEPRRTWLVITRRDYIVRRIAVSQNEFIALQSLMENNTVEQTLQIVLETSQQQPEALGTRLQRWFQNWAANHFFNRIITPE